MDTMKIGDFKIESGKIEFVCQFNEGGGEVRKVYGLN